MDGSSHGPRAAPCWGLAQQAFSGPASLLGKALLSVMKKDWLPVGGEKGSHSALALASGGACNTVTQRVRPRHSSCWSGDWRTKSLRHSPAFAVPLKDRMEWTVGAIAPGAFKWILEYLALVQMQTSFVSCRIFKKKKKSHTFFPRA